MESAPTSNTLTRQLTGGRPVFVSISWSARLITSGL